MQPFIKPGTKVETNEAYYNILKEKYASYICKYQLQFPGGKYDCNLR
ncbi:hypothetical protein LAV79_18345 [Peribacillus butanolivorans]